MTTWQFIVGISEKFSQTIWRTNIWDCKEFEFYFYGGTFWFKSSTLWQTLSLHLNIVIDWLLQRPLLSHIWAFQGTGTTKRVNVVKNDILYSIGKSEPCQFTNNKVRRCVGAHPDKTYWISISHNFNYWKYASSALFSWPQMWKWRRLCLLNYWKRETRPVCYIGTQHLTRQNMLQYFFYIYHLGRVCFCTTNDWKNTAVNGRNTEVM